MAKYQTDDSQGFANSTHERGQTLALIAVMLVGLIGMLGLVLDGGNLYLHRRELQNAADAGALAGARVLAMDGTEAEADGAAQEYAVVRNEADSALVTISTPGGGNPLVTVLAQAQVPMTFARVLGINELSVNAQAQATFTTAGAGIGCAPLAIQDYDYDRGCYPGGPEYYIWDDTKDSDPATGHIAGAYRGWLNLDCRGENPPACGDAGASDEKDWMRNGYPDAIESDTWIRGSSGVKSAVLTQAYPGQLLIIPLYTAIQELHPGKDYYRVVNFAAFRVTQVVSKSNPKGLKGCFEDYVNAAPPSGNPDRGVRTVILTQ
jgi:hypothetical protein